MKHAQAQQKAPDRVQSRKREANALDTPVPRARVKAERKPAAKTDASPDAAGTNPPLAGKKLPPAADSDAATDAAPQVQVANAPPTNGVPVPVAALLLQPVSATESTAPAGSVTGQAPVNASPAPPAAPAPIATASLPLAPESTHGSGLPAVVHNSAQKPDIAPKFAATPNPAAPPAAHSAAAATDTIPTPSFAADPLVGAVAAGLAAAVTTPVDPAATGKPKVSVAAGANPGSTGSSLNSAAEVASSSAAQALISNPVSALNASAPGADRDAGSRGAAQVLSLGAAAPDATSPTATAAVNTPATAAASAADPAVFKLHQGLDSPDFPQALADKVAWLVDKDIGSAKLQINPPQLGPIDVHIEVQGDKAQVWLSAHSVVTREALEASSPKLRDMLGSQGFAQVSVDVSQRSFQDRSAPSPQTQWLPTAARNHPDELFSAPTAQPRRLGPGALDAYA